MTNDTYTLDRLAPPGHTAPDALLDDFHRGDILGALGTIRLHDTAPRTSWVKRLLTLLAVMGPGLVVMVGDNDAGGVATYAQAGQNYGTTLLWVLFLLIPVLIVNQEMVVRLGVTTGVGHARLIIERFGRFWGAFSVGDLFILNFLTIMTEFIGVSLSLGYFGVSQFISVPIAAVVLVAVTVTGSFRRWERAMYLCVAANFLAIPLAFLSHPKAGLVAHDFFVPQLQGGVNSTILLLIIALVGTTVAPWQLFFQQSNVIDKRITPRFYRYEFADTCIGAVVVIVIVGAAALMIATAFAFQGTALVGQFSDAGTAAAQLGQKVGAASGAILAICLLNASIIGASAVTLASSYAFGDVFKVAHSLHRSWKEGWAFHLAYSLQVVFAAGLVLLSNSAIQGLVTTGVQALAGILLPSATVFLLLLCNDKAVLGPRVNKPWLNAVATVIVGILVMLSLILASTTLFPSWDVRPLVAGLSGVLIVGLAITGALYLRNRGRRALAAARAPTQDPMSWRMPPLSTLPKARWSAVQTVGMVTLRGYLLVAVALLVFRVVQLALTGGHGG